MEAERIKEILKEALVAVLQQPLPEAEGDDDAWLSMTGWDSMKQVEILLVLEEECGIRYTEEEFPDLDTAAKIFALTQIKCNEAPTDDGADDEDDGFSYF